MSESAEFAVLRDEYGPIDPEIVAGILVERLGWARFDAIRAARTARGLVAERLERGAADALASGLGQRGVPARVIAQGLVVAIDRPLLVRRLELGDELRILPGYTGDFVGLPWDRCVLVSAGGIVEVEECARVRTVPKRAGRRVFALMSGLAMPGVRTITKAVRGVTEASVPARVARPGQSYELCLADLFVLDQAGSYQHLRLRSRDLAYPEVLGDLAVKDHAEDFRRVLARILERATRAQVTPETQALLGDGEGADDGDPHFGEETEFDAYNRWVLQRMLSDSGV